jgi:transposase
MSRQPLTLTAGQRSRLRRQLRQTSDARVYRRTLAIPEVAQGKPVAQVARALGVARRAAHYWVEGYCRSCDPAALLEGDRPGRPTLWTEQARGLLQELLAGEPDERGYEAVNWTVPLLRQELRHAAGARLSDDTIRRELRRLGYAWKRPRYALAPDPELEKKTPDLPAHPRAAAAQRRPGGGRDRPAAAAAPAGLLGAARPAGAGVADR